MKKGDLFPIAHCQPEIEELRATVGGVPLNAVRAQYTGELRPPRKGEWYLSGAVVEAYYNGYADLASPCHIAVLVRVRTKTTLDIVAYL